MTEGPESAYNQNPLIPATRRVILESPYAGDRATNERYARAAMRDCLERGDSPYASHMLLTQPGISDDDVPDERRIGIDAGFLWHEVAHATVVYTDLGVSRGMNEGIANAHRLGQPVEFRTLKGWSKPSHRDKNTETSNGIQGNP